MQFRKFWLERDMGMMIMFGGARRVLMPLG